MGFLGVVCDDRDECVAKLLELEFCLGIEERKGGQVDSSCWVLGIKLDGICCGGDFAVADSNVAK